MPVSVSSRSPEVLITPISGNAFQDLLVLDPAPHPVQQRRVPDLVETRLDVGFQHPLMRVAGQEVDPSNRVLGAAVGPEPHPTGQIGDGPGQSKGIRLAEVSAAGPEIGEAM